MELSVDIIFTVGTAVVSAATVIAICRNDISHLKEAIKGLDDKRFEQMTEIFRRLNSLEQSRPTHDDLGEIHNTINSMDTRIRNTETGVATMAVEIKGIEKALSRLSHTCVSTNSLVQLLVLNNPSLSSKEKSDFLSSTHQSGAEK
jgi:hypothetical protein